MSRLAKILGTIDQRRREKSEAQRTAREGLLGLLGRQSYDGHFIEIMLESNSYTCAVVRLDGEEVGKIECLDGAYNLAFDGPSIQPARTIEDLDRALADIIEGLLDAKANRAQRPVSK
jgi:hypothetical protein